MKILFLISICSFLALAWAAFSMARHVRRNTGSRPLDAAPDPLLETLEPASTRKHRPRRTRPKVTISH